MSDIPSGWKRSTIGEVSAYIQRGKSPKYVDQSDLPVINQKCIRWEELQLQHLKYIHPEQFSAWDESRFIKAGDILWNSTGTGTVGRAYHVKEVDCTHPKVVDSHVTIVRATPEMDSRYLFNWIKGPDVQGKIEEMCDGTTNQIELSRTAIAATAIPIAPRDEQGRIADQLDTLLTRIQSCNDRFDVIPALLKRFRLTVLGAATTGVLTQDWRLAGSTPWKNVRLTEVASSFTYGSAAKSAKSGDVPVLRMGNIQHGRLDWSDLVYTSDPKEIEKYKLAKGDVLFNRTNSPELVGKTAVYQGEQTAIYAGYLIRVRCSAELLPEYLNYCLGSKAGRDYCWSVKSDGVSQSNINAKKLAAFPFALPAVDEQTEIVRRVEALFAFADRIEARATAARAHVQRLSPLVLAKAFRGELVQQDQQDEPVGVLLQRIAATQPAKATASRGRPRVKQRECVTAPLVSSPDWAALPDAVWAAPEDFDEHAVVAVLVAVLKTWGGPMPQPQARLAAVLCQQPQQMAAALPADQAIQWQRLVGHTAEPLPTQVARLQPATSGPWRKALTGMRARGDLVEVGIGPQGTWAMGAGAAQIETAGWPEGRAGWVVGYLRAHGVEAVLPLLEPLTVEFVHARAA